MIDALRLTAGWALVWAFGIAVTASLPHGATRRRVDASHPAWTLGAGFLVGAFGLTVWMRLLSYVGLRFSVASIAWPLALATLALGGLLWRRARFPARLAWPPRLPVSRGARLLFIGLALWLLLRFVLLLLDVVWTPLTPWDAWIQWATKARVWYAFGHIVPFGRSDAWFAANGAIFFDASPDYPATIPLWQVWSSLALGRWDDALMNLPWWLTALGFALAVYGLLRDAELPPLGALVGAWLVSSLPLANAHVALAGYADLPMAVYYALAAVTLWRAVQTRSRADAALALLFAIACMAIKKPGLVWAATLVPGIVLAVAGHRARTVNAIGYAVVVFALLILARTHPVVLGYRLHLDFAPAWDSLIDSLFLLGNWNLLWYLFVAMAMVGWRTMREPRLAPLTAVVAAGLFFLAIVFAFTNARDWVTGQTTINRATLHIAPLAILWMILVFDRWRRSLAPASLASAPVS